VSVVSGRRIGSRALAAAVGALVLALAAIAITGCGAGARTITVTHGPVTLVYADVGDPGPSVGDTRGTETATQVEGSQVAGRLDAILTTTAIDSPSAGVEVRIGHLVFAFGDGTDQIVVDGTSLYPSASATIAVGATTIRPIVGGSGIYAGARGYAESTHLDDGTWRHVLHLQP
jgi:hypothetical protein